MKLEIFVPEAIFNQKMRNTLKFYILAALSAFILNGCLTPETVIEDKNPYIMNIDSPKSGDSVVVGRNFITYSAEDNPLGGGFANFEVFINGSSHKVFKVTADSSSPVLYFDLTESQLGKTVSVYVTAWNTNGGYKTSEPVTGLIVKVNTNPPPAPDSLIAPYITPTAILLVWRDNSMNETGYEIYRSSTNNTNYGLLVTLPENTISFADYTVSSGINYFYKVRAKNKYGLSGFSNEVGITAGGSTTSSDSPYDFKADVLGATQVQLFWKQSSTSSLNGFEIQRRQSSTDNWVAVAYLPNTAREYTDKNLTASMTYMYRIVAIYATKKTYSSEITVTTAYKDIPAPTNLTALFNSADGIISLSWTNNSNQENGTYIERKDDVNDFQVIAITAAGASSFSDPVYSQLNQSGITYQYRIRQLTTESFFTPYSNTASVFIPFTRPVAPKNFTISELTEGERYLLTWTYQVGTFDYFEVYLREGLSPNYQLFTTTSLSYTLQGLVKGNVYGVKVRAVKGNVGGDYTNEFTTPLLKPINLTATLSYNVITPFVTLNWTNRASNANFVEIERRNVGDVNFKKIASTNLASPFNDITVSVQSDYEYRIRVIRTDPPLSTSNYSNIVKVIIP